MHRVSVRLHPMSTCPQFSDKWTLGEDALKLCALCSLVKTALSVDPKMPCLSGLLGFYKKKTLWFDSTKKKTRGNQSVHACNNCVGGTSFSHRLCASTNSNMKRSVTSYPMPAPIYDLSFTTNKPLSPFVILESPSLVPNCLGCCVGSVRRLLVYLLLQIQAHAHTYLGQGLDCVPLVLADRTGLPCTAVGTWPVICGVMKGMWGRGSRGLVCQRLMCVPFC